MDGQESVSDVISSPEHGDVPFLLELGNWRVAVNRPHGFVAYNIAEKEEYHFFCDSNGWITGRNMTNPNKPAVACFNSIGAQIGYPILVDKDNTEKWYRMNELRLKEELTFEEQEELLKLAGVRK